MDPARHLKERLIPGCRSPLSQIRAVTTPDDVDEHGHERPPRHGAHGNRPHCSYERELRRYGTAEEHIDDHRQGGHR